MSANGQHQTKYTIFCLYLWALSYKSTSVNEWDNVVKGNPCVSVDERNAPKKKKKNQQTEVTTAAHLPKNLISVMVSMHCLQPLKQKGLKITYRI